MSYLILFLTSFRFISPRNQQLCYSRFLVAHNFDVRLIIRLYPYWFKPRITLLKYLY